MRAHRVPSSLQHPGPVVGGFAFALIALALRQAGAATVEFDTTLQSPVMVMFFTTIGLTGSFALIKKGGKLLLIYVAACWGLAIAQNLIGIGMAMVVGIDPLLGIMAGAVSLERGHGVRPRHSGQRPRLWVLMARRP